MRRLSSFSVTGAAHYFLLFRSVHSLIFFYSRPFLQSLERGTDTCVRTGDGKVPSTCPWDATIGKKSDWGEEGL